MNKTQSDEELMLGYRNGDAAAFEVLYIRHKGALYRYLLRQCRIAAVAEELLQDVWLNLVRARERYEVKAKFTTYLFREETGLSVEQIAEVTDVNPETAKSRLRYAVARLRGALGKDGN